MSEQEQNNNIANEEVNTPPISDTEQTEFIPSSDEEITEKETPKMPVKAQLAVLSVFLLGVFSVGATPLLVSKLNEKPATDIAVYSQEKESEQDKTGNPYQNLNLLATSALVVDVRDGEVLFSREADKVWPLASVTKLMTILLASELVEGDELVTVTAEAVAQDGDSGLRAGETFLFSDLSDLTILTSSNDGAYALAYAAGAKLDNKDPASAFVQAMNIRAKEIGLKETYFRNPTGLDLSEDESGAYGTARDMAILLNYILENQPAVLEKTTVLRGVVRNLNNETHQVANTNTAVNAIPGLIGSKTGYTTLSGGNLAIAFDAGVGHPVIVVVLGSTHQGRLSDVLQLVEATREQM